MFIVWIQGDVTITPMEYFVQTTTERVVLLFYICYPNGVFCHEWVLKIPCRPEGALFAALWDKLKRVRAGVKDIYDDSSQHETIGGTRMSERKSPTRKATPST